MSSILTEYSSSPLFQERDAAGGLQIIAQNGQSNFFTSDILEGNEEDDLLISDFD